MGFRIGRGGKRFFAVCENLDHESENRIYDSKISKIGKKFRNSTKFAKCFPKCAKCHFRVCAKCNSEMSIFADFAKMPKCQKIGIGVAKTPKSDKNPVFRQKNDQKTRQKHGITRAKMSILYVRCGRNYRKIHCLEGPPPPPKTRFLAKSANPRTRKTQPVSDAPLIPAETVARHIMNQS